ncbi:antA/AntB antirepressor family protein [Brevibacillus agri]|uniref:antA/AntB antirepressor family protein n=1 Tax=Brevibacillus agri TaxID=51101 RepID=UPI0025B6E60C|nr:antA/AntB antirepressor family protein [Brevibacillus agri]MDN4093594.1 antA/AntB antirepressor family protein [Brevibacillus agri]
MKSIKLENGNKVKVFEKKDIVEKLGRSLEDWQLIRKYQKQFPMLTIVESKEKFPIDGEDLCKSLEVTDHYTTWLLTETKRDNKGNIKKQGKLRKYRFVEGKDFFAESQKSTGGRPKLVIKLTVDCATKIAMKQNNKAGDLVADYFILMEKIMKEIDEWAMVREPEKEGYKQLCELLRSAYMLKNEGKEPSPYVYSNEADMINKCLLGAKAKQIRKLLEADDSQTREHLRTEVNQALYELQLMDIGFLMHGLEFDQRKTAIMKICDTKYKHIKLNAEKLVEAINT